MILAMLKTIPNGFISNEREKLAGTKVGSFTAFRERRPLKLLAVSKATRYNLIPPALPATPTHAENKNLQKYKNAEIVFI